MVLGHPQIETADYFRVHLESAVRALEGHVDHSRSEGTDLIFDAADGAAVSGQADAFYEVSQAIADIYLRRLGAHCLGIQVQQDKPRLGSPREAKPVLSRLAPFATHPAG